MLSSGNKRTIRSYTSSYVSPTSGPFLGSSQGFIQLCCDGAGILYVSSSETNYYKINPVNAVVTAGLASAYNVSAISVTLDGIVFFASGASVYAVGGAYGSTPILLFSPPNGVYRQCFYVNSTGTAVYCTDTNGTRICVYTAWSGGSATRTVITTTSTGSGETAFAGTDGGMIAAGAAVVGLYSEIIPRWYGPLESLFTSLPNSYYITDYTNRLIYAYGVAVDSDMSVIYVTGGNPQAGTQNNAACSLRQFPPGQPSGITIPITAWSPYAVAVHPLTRAIYVMSYGITSRGSVVGAYSNIITLTPNY
jgi:hypothetical protein